MTHGVQAQPITQRTRIMGVLNATPDSFYAPSRIDRSADIVQCAAKMIEHGADLLDIGGESSRPGSDPVSTEEELARVLPQLHALRPLEATLSIDTYRADTARQAIAAGATLVNDITALRGDDAMAGVVADSACECVLMHMLGTPKSMQHAPCYDDVVDDISAFFEERIAFATGQGISEKKIWLDPGFGFGKTVGHNLTLLRRLGELKRFGLRLLIGTSNKSTIGTVLDLPVDQRLEGTAATIAIAIHNGADAVRVHDVAAMARVVRMSDAIVGKAHHD